jgi:hypothetical protein
MEVRLAPYFTVHLRHLRDGMDENYETYQRRQVGLIFHTKAVSNFGLKFMCKLCNHITQFFFFGKVNKNYPRKLSEHYKI